VRTTKVLPWFVKRWILFRRDAVCPELYHLAQDDGSSDDSDGKTYYTDRKRE